MQASDIVVVRGSYDHVERVLDALELPFTAVDPSQVEHLGLRPEQLLVVNCPGNVSSGAVPVIRNFVAAGGSLFTTDWALRHVIEPASRGRSRTTTGRRATTSCGSRCWTATTPSCGA